MADDELVHPRDIVFQVEPRVAFTEEHSEGGGGDFTPGLAENHVEQLGALRFVRREVVG